MIDLKKKSEWTCLRQDTSHQQVWVGEPTESESSSVVGELESMTLADDKIVDGTDTNLAKLNEQETLSDYFSRTKNHWIELSSAETTIEHTGEETSENTKKQKEIKKMIKKAAFDLAKLEYEEADECV